MKKISFKTIHSNFYLEQPKPAFKLLPEWYRKTDRVAKGMETVKTCIPFLDAMTSGYMIVLGADIHFHNGQLQQISELQMVSHHDSIQLGSFHIPAEYDKQPFKWNNFFITKTPKGYSSMISHPINRLDLPFYTLSGVVDTDEYPAPVNFPFFVRKDFSGIIPEGTPIAQVVPFKREDWKASVEDKKDTKIPAFFQNNVFSPPFNFYKRVFWKRKKYQ